jgi:hypothetical protein
MFGSNYNNYRVKLGYNPRSLTESQWYFYRIATWTKEFAWLPHRCMLTKKYIWLEYAYRGKAVYLVEDRVVINEYKWHDYDEHIIWELQK